MHLGLQLFETRWEGEWGEGDRSREQCGHRRTNFACVLDLLAHLEHFDDASLYEHLRYAEPEALTPV